MKSRLSFIINRILGKFLKLLSLLRLCPNVLNIKKSLVTIYSSNCSLSRFGDGEFELMSGKSINFQSANPIIATRLMEVATSNCKGHYVAIPGVFTQLHTFKSSARRYWEKYLFEQGGIKLLLNTFGTKKYLDAFVSRFYEHLRDKTCASEYVALWKKIFRGKDLLIIEGEGSRLGVYNNLFDEASSIIRIICPAENAFTYYNKILNASKKHGIDKLILIALGPTATILAYDLAKEGYQALDIGHIDTEYEWYLMKATRKEKLSGRYVNETGQRCIEKCTEKSYLKQIIVTIESSDLQL